MFNRVNIQATGSTIATGAASASVALPNNAAGVAPEWVRVVATAAAYVKVGPSTVTAAAGDMLVQPGDGVLLRAKGWTHIAAIQVTAGGTVQISPVEDAR
jgi:aspartate/methionine/tyrosine aminotransferase